MIGRSGTGWQTTTADLALILFFVVSAAASMPDRASHGNGKPALQKVAAPIEATPSAAIYRPTDGTTLTQWLRSQPRDDRQVATVLVSRSRIASTPAMIQALALLDDIEASGRSGRLLVEPGDADDVAVVLAYEHVPASGTALAPR